MLVKNKRQKIIIIWEGLLFLKSLPPFICRKNTFFFNVHTCKYRLYRRSTNKSVERQLLIVLNPFKDTRAYLHVVFSSVHFG